MAYKSDIKSHVACVDTELSGKYFIWNPSSTKPPTVYFDDRPSAIKVACSMAKSNPGQQFTVAKVVGSARAPLEPKYESFDD